MTDFSSLKKSSSTSLQNLNKKLEALQTKDYSKKDDGFWTPTVDEQGNGFAVIRFLPTPKGEEDPFVRLFSHGFKGPGGWYIENSLTTLNQEDPVSKVNSALWDTGIEAKKEEARKQKRRLSFISNIYVEKDSKNPAAEGKVFKYRYGKKIFDKIGDASQPEFDDETPMDPFNLWTGASFKLKIRKVEGFSNYDKSEFDKPSVLGNFNDEQLEEIYNQMYSLQEIIDPKNFKSYEELQKRLNKVLGLSDVPSTAPVAEAKQSRVAETVEEKTANPFIDDEGDEDLAFLKNLVD